MKYNDATIVGRNACIVARNVFSTQKKTWDPKNDAWNSQKLCLTINWPYFLIMAIVRQHLWDCFWDPKNDAWQLTVQDRSRDDGHLFDRHNFWELRKYPRNEMMNSLLSGTTFGILVTIPEMMPDNHQATFFGSSSIIFGHKKKPKQGKGGCFRDFFLIPSYVNLC